MDDIIKRKMDEYLKRAQEICEINFAYIFGSYARGEQKENSDIDIAIMPQKSYEAIEEVFIRGSLIEIGKEVFKKNVDVVFLNTDSIFLKYEIIRDGIIIKDSIDRISYESLVMREYLDFKYYSDYYNEVVLNSMKANKKVYSMVSRDIVLKRISRLNEYLDFLKDIQKYSMDEYLNNPMIYGSAERFLHLLIECIIDISSHIIADMRYRKPTSNREIFEILYENKIINDSLKEKLSNMAGFRNILVHDYIKLNKKIVYEIIQNNLKDMENFINIIAEYI